MFIKTDAAVGAEIDGIGPEKADFFPYAGIDAQIVLTTRAAEYEGATK